MLRNGPGCAQCTSSSRSRRLLTTKDDAAQERGLTDVLQIVGGNADEPNAERHGWVPARVDNAVEVRLSKARDVAVGSRVHGVVVVGQERGVADPNRPDLLGWLTKTSGSDVERELEAYGEDLADKPRLIALNKIDLADAELARGFADELKQAGAARVFPISGATGAGIGALLDAVLDFLPERAATAQSVEEEDEPGEWSPLD